jgi:hypothetical protein
VQTCVVHEVICPQRAQEHWIGPLLDARTRFPPASLRTAEKLTAGVPDVLAVMMPRICAPAAESSGPASVAPAPAAGKVNTIDNSKQTAYLVI